MSSKCEMCGTQIETRLGHCWMCAETESIMHEGTDMYDKGPGGPKLEVKAVRERMKMLIEKGYLRNPAGRTGAHQ